MSILRFSAMAILAAALTTGTASQSHAGKRGMLKGLGFGFGAAILLNELSKEAERQRHREKPRYSGGGAYGQDRPLRAVGSSWMTPADVSKMQAALNALGFDAGDVDGRGGSQTTAAVRKFQADAGGRVTGAMTPAEFVSLLQQAQVAENSGRIVEQGVPTPSTTTATPSRPGGHPVQPDLARASPSTVASAAPAQSVREFPPLSTNDRRSSAPSTVSPSPRLVPQAPATRAVREVADAQRPSGSSNPVDHRISVADHSGVSPDVAQPANPDLPKVSANGKFTEYSRSRQVIRVFERSSAGRRVVPAACALACLENIKCQAYASFVDGRCELGEDVSKTAAGEGVGYEFAVVGVRRSVEAAAAP